MDKVTNLNRFRKQKTLAAKKARADENATKFGRTKTEKSLQTARDSKAASVLDGHKLDPPTDKDL